MSAGTKRPQHKHKHVHAQNGQLLYFWFIILRHSKTRWRTFAYAYAYVYAYSVLTCQSLRLCLYLCLCLCRSENQALVNNIPAENCVRSINEGNSPEAGGDVSFRVPWLIMHAFLDALGVGDHIHNFVYRFAPWHDLGCWRDTGDGRTMTLLANFRGKIDWFHMEKTGKYE